MRHLTLLPITYMNPIALSMILNEKNPHNNQPSKKNPTPYKIADGGGFLFDNSLTYHIDCLHLASKIGHCIFPPYQTNKAYKIDPKQFSLYHVAHDVTIKFYNFDFAFDYIFRSFLSHDW